MSEHVDMKQHSLSEILDIHPTISHLYKVCFFGNFGAVVGSASASGQSLYYELYCSSTTRILLEVKMKYFAERLYIKFTSVYFHHTMSHEMHLQ